MSKKDRHTLNDGTTDGGEQPDDRALLKLVLQLMYDHEGKRRVLGVEEIASQLEARGHRLTPTHVGTLWNRAIECVLDGSLGLPTRRRRRAKGIKKNGPDDRALTELVAWLYCRNGAGQARTVQAELERLGFDICWQAVAKRFERALEDGLVKMVFEGPTEKKECAALVHGMMDRFHIRRALVIPGVPAILSAHGKAARAAIRREMVGRAAPTVIAELERILIELAKAGRTSVRVGVSWGGTLARIARALARTSRPRGLPPVIELVPIVGLTGNRSSRPVEAFAVASLFARGMTTQFTHADAAHLPAPAFVTQKEYEIVIRLTQVDSMLKEIRDCDVVITSVGPVLSADGPDETTFSPDPGLNAAVYQDMKAHKAVGDICGIPIGPGGRPIDPVEMRYRSVGIDHETLREMVDALCRHVIVVACGDRTRIEPLRAVINGHLATTVITDSVMARALLE